MSAAAAVLPDDATGAAEPAAESTPIPSVVIGTAVFLFTEVMMFAGLVSSYLVLRGRAPVWPPLDQPRLPAAATALQTVLLVASGVVIAGARTGDARALVRRLSATLALGGAFLLLQGREWAALVAHGLGQGGGPYGGTFYTIVGVHGVHVCVAVLTLGLATVRAGAGRLDEPGLRAVRMYWWFVVAVWPPLYALVYLW